MAFQRQKTGGDRRQGAAARFRRAGTGDASREGAVRRPLDPRDQVRRLSRPGPLGQRGGQDIHPPRPRLDAPFQEGRPRRLAYQGELNRRGRRDRRAGRRRHDDFSVLQNELKGKSKSIVLVAFDLLYLNGRYLRKLPLYAGKVDHGFDKKSAADLQKRLKPLIRKTQPYAKRIAHKGAWVEPKLLAEIEYRAKSAEGKVRHQFFRGLREDL